MSKKGDELMKDYHDSVKDGCSITELMPMANYIPQSEGSCKVYISSFSGGPHYANLLDVDISDFDRYLEKNAEECFRRGKE